MRRFLAPFSIRATNVIQSVPEYANTHAETFVVLEAKGVELSLTLSLSAIC